MGLQFYMNCNIYSKVTKVEMKRQLTFLSQYSKIYFRYFSCKFNYLIQFLFFMNVEKKKKWRFFSCVWKFKFREEDDLKAGRGALSFLTKEYYFKNMWIILIHSNARCQLKKKKCKFFLEKIKIKQYFKNSRAHRKWKTLLFP